MDRQKEHGDPGQTPVHRYNRELEGPPDFAAPQKPIAEFVTRPDYPECLVGEHVLIGGYAGVVVAVVKNSIKVRSPEGFTRSFNTFGLRRIYGPPPELDPIPPSPSASELTSTATRKSQHPAPKAEPPREIVTEPNFKQPIVPVADLVSRADFPRSALGKRVEIGGYIGVVVEILNHNSLKVRSPQGTSRSYNATGLRAIYAKR
jgi:hypothetical protein